MSIKFFDKVTETVNQTNKDWLGVVNAGDDLIGLIEAYSDPTSTAADRELATVQFTNNLVAALASYSPAAEASVASMNCKVIEGVKYNP